MPRILDSARRHGCSDDDILHAFYHPRTDQLVDDNEGHPVRAIKGPARSGVVELELLASIDDDERIFHAYSPARPTFPR